MIHYEKSINYVHKDKFTASKDAIEATLASVTGVEIVALSGYDWQNTFCGWIGVRQPATSARIIAPIRPNDITTANCVAACEQVVEALGRNRGGERCEACGSGYADRHVPFKCVVCEKQTINTCPSCAGRYSLDQYRQMPKGIYSCPSCNTKLALDGGTERQWHLTKK